MTERAQPRRDRRRLLAPVALACTAALCATGCSSQDASTEEELEAELAAALGPGEVDVDIDPDTDIITVEGERGSYVQGAGQDRPSWLPAEIPLPDDVDIDWTSEIGGIFRLTGTTGEDGAALQAVFAAAAADGGWTVEPNPQPIADETVVVLAFLADGTPLDVRLADGVFELFLGRYWPPPE